MPTHATTPADRLAALAARAATEPDPARVEALAFYGRPLSPTRSTLVHGATIRRVA